MSGEIMNYKFGQKNHWRRTIWNAIADRLAVPAKDAVVFYLGGANDLDREVAKQKGFRSNNLIFIDKSREIVQRQRSEQKLAIQADFLAAIRAVPKSMKADVVFGDFCCGLSPELLDGIEQLCLTRGSHHAVFAYNFLRGRDPRLNPLRESLAPGLEHSQLLSEKHRGRIALMFVMYGIFVRSHPWVQMDEDGGFSWKPPREMAHGEASGIVERYVASYANKARPQLLSYRSVSRQTFDSCVFVNPFFLYPSDSMKSAHGALDKNCDASIRRQISAIAAHRTMRKTAVGPYAREAT